MKIRKSVGIDLGTTNSVIAMLDATDSSLITGQDDQGRMTFPSVVGHDAQQGKLVVGRAALAMKADINPPVLPLSSVKRFMGLDRNFQLGPHTLTPPQASAAILGLLRDRMAQTLHDANYLLDSAVVTMPAYFNHNQIEATRQAGELAGFEVVELLHEPTAAAIYYSWILNHGDATYLVYDLGGGTFDVSIIRRRFGDYEVLSVSGDPFLGGDDFDRLLASHLIEAGSWALASGVACTPAANLFDPATSPGAVHFARLVHIAEGIKIEMSGPLETSAGRDRAQRYIPDLIKAAEGESLTLEATVERTSFERLIKDKVDRTIDCCHEALARAKERAGIRLVDIDYIVLVGGSSRVPLVRETVREAFCNNEKPEHVKCLQPLLHEPDLCVAYGAALRAATHGTYFLLPVPMHLGLTGSAAESLEMRWTSPTNTRDVRYQATGIVRLRGPVAEAASHRSDATRHDAASSDAMRQDTSNLLGDGSVLLRNRATGMVEEAFLDARGTFAQDLELQPQADNLIDVTLCDGSGSRLAGLAVCIRHQEQGRPLGQAVLATQLITKPLQIEVLSRSRQRIKQVIAPIGAALPARFECTCRTSDQSGRIVVPIYEENRVVKQMVIEDLDPGLAVGSPVEVEFTIDVKHTIGVRLRVRGLSGNSERTETATIEAAPPPRRPTRAEIEEVQKQIEEFLGQLRGSVRTRLRARAHQLGKDLHEALRYDDEPKAIQRMAELRDLAQLLEQSKGQMLDPPWPRFAQLVRHCLDLAVELANATGRDRQELFDHIQAQERYGEQAFEEHNQPLYRECWENLEKYAGYLEQLRRDSLPRPPTIPTRPPEEEAKDDLDGFRAYLAVVWKHVRAKQRTDLEARLKELAGQASGMMARLKSEPVAVLREVRRLSTEIHKIEEQLTGNRRQSDDDAGLLEGSS